MFTFTLDGEARLWALVMAAYKQAEVSFRPPYGDLVEMAPAPGGEGWFMLRTRPQTKAEKLAAPHGPPWLFTFTDGIVYRLDGYEGPELWDPKPLTNSVARMVASEPELDPELTTHTASADDETPF